MTAAVPHDNGCALLSAAGGEPTACSCTASLGLGTDRPTALEPEPEPKPNPQPDLDTTPFGRYHDMELALEGARALLRLAGETPADGNSRGA